MWRFLGFLHILIRQNARKTRKKTPRDHGSRGIAGIYFYSRRMPAFSHAAVVSSSQTDACTSPMCAFPSNSMDRRD